MEDVISIKAYFDLKDKLKDADDHRLGGLNGSKAKKAISPFLTKRLRSPRSKQRYEPYKLEKRNLKKKNCELMEHFETSLPQEIT